MGYSLRVAGPPQKHTFESGSAAFLSIRFSGDSANCGEAVITASPGTETAQRKSNVCKSLWGRLVAEQPLERVVCRVPFHPRQLAKASNDASPRRGSCEHGTKTNSIRKAAATNGDVCSGMRRAQIAFQRHDHIILKMLKFLNTNT